MSSDTPNRDEDVTGPVLNVHASAIAIGGLGILVRGPARSGKSALCLSALRRGASLDLPSFLVADDRVLLEAADGQVTLRAHPGLRGMIEISGVGILREATIPSTSLALVAELCPEEEIDRYPEIRETLVAGASVRLVRLPRRQSAFCADILVSLALCPDPPG
ncbi:HPr kinase/phosphorylase [Aurantimonas sp. VKM B-3413]|uniref:HPr kinase/phosphorylase n=1 Tax=Aurantimonas sp. VKM B-3413 TaxID=2779401 RepID=UPI001E3C61FB|nr:HPr kinase/phosphatase C-terminal domain-containing protein [Aurantimonas sp. VKM B-3413]MCB8837329.1 HPr kinase/phosphatase C-terminal domain-containing protein [Aurantimonas sp. VKM B-3413]